eukprot:5221796-Pyramimonas_sp.AAC.1
MRTTAAKDYDDEEEDEYATRRSATILRGLALTNNRFIIQLRGVFTIAPAKGRRYRTSQTC